jgi:hypothetical protein
MTIVCWLFWSYDRLAKFTILLWENYFLIRWQRGKTIENVPNLMINNLANFTTVIKRATIALGVGIREKLVGN